MSIINWAEVGVGIKAISEAHRHCKVAAYGGHDGLENCPLYLEFIELIKTELSFLTNSTPKQENKPLFSPRYKDDKL